MYFLLLILIYIAFISLGLPDSVLGAAWPSMYRSFGVPEGSAGIITMLCLMALPYGLGGGCVDASLNNYVATHYKARHMNFLHCFWGIGTIISPLIMGSFIENGGMWTQGYRAIAVFQFILVAVLMLSIPLWKKDSQESYEDKRCESFIDCILQLLRSGDDYGIMDKYLSVGGQRSRYHPGDQMRNAVLHRNSFRQVHIMPGFCLIFALILLTMFLCFRKKHQYN